MSRGSVSSRSRSPLPSESAVRSLRAGVLVLAALALVAGCGGLVDPQPTEVPTSPRRPAVFNHESHLDKGLECLDCHETYEDEDAPGMPDPEFCMECHEDMEEEAPPDKQIAAFLTGPAEEPEWSSVTKLSAEVIFSHLAHIEEELDCGDCHTGIETATSITMNLALDMETCTSCHTQESAPNDCKTCHTELGRDWQPPSHDRLWSTLHGMAARRGNPQALAEDCSLCHTQNSCAACHAVEAPRDHTEAWRVGGGHGLASAMDRGRCSTCHQTDTCATCHATTEPRSHRGSWGGQRSRHCVSCHLPLRSGTDEGCAVCHESAPSHAMAPRKPDWHTPDMQCLLCHSPVPHADNGQNCNICHR